MFQTEYSLRIILHRHRGSWIQSTMLCPNHGWCPRVCVLCPKMEARDEDVTREKGSLLSKLSPIPFFTMVWIDENIYSSTLIFGLFRFMNVLVT